MRSFIFVSFGNSSFVRTIKNGLLRFGGPSFAFSAGSSGKARFSASLTPNAMAFSNAIPKAVGTAPFQKAAIPCEQSSRLKRKRKFGVKSEPAVMKKSYT